MIVADFSKTFSSNDFLVMTLPSSSHIPLFKLNVINLFWFESFPLNDTLMCYFYKIMKSLVLRTHVFF